MSIDLPDRAVVLLGEEPVGALTRREQSSRFEPSESWADTAAGERHVLGQQFEEDPYSAHRSRHGAPIWFEHLLPEAGGPLRTAVARALGISETGSFALLIALGEDLPGAVRVRTDAGENPFETIARRERSGSASAEESNPAPLPLRVSLAGLQFKISAKDGKRGIGVPAAGEEGDWILKFADQRFPSLPHNEFWTMNWAGQAGLDVPTTRIVRTEEVEGIDSIAEATGEYAFAIERYDRTPSGRIHQEDFAQVLGLEPGDAKYFATNIDTILRVVATLSPTDLPELIARLSFCVLAGNDDAHAKNFSLWYPEPSVPRLSPAYDLVATVEFFPNNDMSLKLAKARRFSEVRRSRFRRLAERTGQNADEVEELVVDAVRRQLAAWAEIRNADDLDPGYREMIDARLNDLPLAADCA